MKITHKKDGTVLVNLTREQLELLGFMADKAYWRDRRDYRTAEKWLATMKSAFDKEFPEGCGDKRRIEKYVYR